MKTRTLEATVTTDAGGDATAFLPTPGSGESALDGRVLRISYTKTDYATGVDFTITSEKTLQNLWVESDVDASKSVGPTQVIQHDDGTDRLGGGAYIHIANERIKIVVANGGDTKSGLFTVVVG